jgi:hypothetical protein
MSASIRQSCCLGSQPRPTTTNARSRAIEDDDERNDTWMLGVWGAGYTLVGLGTLHVSRHLGQPFHFVLTALGLLLAAAGAWCLLWFAGIALLIGVIGAKHGPAIWRVLVGVVLLLAYAADWWFFLR